MMGLKAFTHVFRMRIDASAQFFRAVEEGNTSKAKSLIENWPFPQTAEQVKTKAFAYANSEMVSLFSLYAKLAPLTHIHAQA